MRPFPHTKAEPYAELAWYEETVRGWIGEAQWPDAVEYFTRVDCTVCFEAYSDMYMLGEFGASILYDMTHERGAWAKRREADVVKHTERAFNRGMEAGRAIVDSGETKTVIYEGPAKFRDTFVEGMQSVMPPELFSKYVGIDLERGTMHYGKDMYSGSSVKH